MSTRLSLCIPVINHRDETLACLESFKRNADAWQDLEIIIVDNGSAVPVLEWGIPDIDRMIIIQNSENKGVLPALQQAYERSHADYIVYTHNDVTMFEEGWDTKVKNCLEGINAGHAKGVGVAGFYGAKGIGISGIYQMPYQMYQLIRVDNVSNCNRMDPAHGYRNIRGTEVWEKVSVMDGFSLIVSTKFLADNGGFDTELPPHHMYDNHTCLQSLDLGYMNIVIAMDAKHHGGVTDVSEDWEKPFGKTKQQIHQDAHYPYFYNYWSPAQANIRATEGRVGLTLPIYIN